MFGVQLYCLLRSWHSKQQSEEVKGAMIAPWKAEPDKTKHLMDMKLIFNEKPLNPTYTALKSKYNECMRNSWSQASKKEPK